VLVTAAGEHRAHHDHRSADATDHDSLVSHIRVAGAARKPGNSRHARGTSHRRVRYAVFVSRIVLGILAGMGPRTTAPFLDAVLERCRRTYGAVWDEHFPDIAVYSLPAPFRPHCVPDRLAMEAALTRGTTALTRAGAQLIAVPCNTAHIYFDAIARAAPDARVLHIVHETLHRLPTGGRAAILATHILAASRLYHDALVRRGYSVLEDSECPGIQTQVDALIECFKSHGTAPATLERWAALRAQLESAGVDRVVLACTDLAFCASADQRGSLDVFDSSAILAEALVDEFCRLEGLDRR
jgi:aspartate racemase